MKKVLATLLCVGAFALAACSPDMKTAESSKSKLQGKEYTVTVYSEEEAKTHFTAFTFEGISVKNALLAEKGSDDDHDLLLAFYFSSIDEAEKFTEIEEHENLGLLNSLLEKELGANLTPKIGTHNNVAYAGSTTTFNIALS